MPLELLSVDMSFSVTLPDVIISNSKTITNLITDCFIKDNVQFTTKFDKKLLVKFKQSLAQLTEKNVSAAIIIYDFLECKKFLYKVGKWALSKLREIPNDVYFIIMTNQKLLYIAMLRDLISLDEISKTCLKHFPSDDEIGTLINNYGADNLNLIGEKLSISFENILNKDPLSIFKIQNNNLFLALLCSDPSIIKNAFNSFYMLFKQDSDHLLEQITNIDLIASRLIVYKKISPNSYNDNDLLNLSFKVPYEYILEKMDLSSVSCSRLDFVDYVDLKQHLDFIFVKAHPKFISSLMRTMYNFSRTEDILYLSNKYENCKFFNMIISTMNLGDLMFLIIIMFMMLANGIVIGVLLLFLLHVLILETLDNVRLHKMSILLFSILNCIDIVMGN